MDAQSYGGKGQTMEINARGVSAIVADTAANMRLSFTGERVPLNDIRRVIDTATDYLDVCAQAGILPTVRGVAAYLGLSRQALYDAAARNPDGALAKWLEDFSDVCGEAVMQAAMAGVVAPVPAIFTTKARYGWREPPAQYEIAAKQVGPLGEEADPSEIAAKYRELPEE